MQNPTYRAQSSATPVYFNGIPFFRPSGTSANAASRSNRAYFGAQADLGSEFLKQQGANQRLQAIAPLFLALMGGNAQPTSGKFPDWGNFGYYVHEGDLRPLVENDPVMVGVLERERRERRSIETRRGVQMAQREGRPHCRAKIGYRLHKGQMLPDLKCRALCRVLLKLNNEGVSCEKLCWRFAINSTSVVHKRIRAAREHFPLNPYMRLDDDGEEVLYCDPGTAPWPSEFEALERRNWSAPAADSCA